MVPNQIASLDGRNVDVRTIVSACQICDQRVRLVAVLVNRFDGNGAVPIAAGEVLGVKIGTDDRDFQVRADAGPEGKRTYVFQYQLPGQGDRNPKIEARLYIGSQTTSPFWAVDAGLPHDTVSH